MFIFYSNFGLPPNNDTKKLYFRVAGIRKSNYVLTTILFFENVSEGKINKIVYCDP